MGGDGGVIATKRKFMRGTSRDDENNKESRNIVQAQKAKARSCALSGQVRSL